MSLEDTLQPTRDGIRGRKHGTLRSKQLGVVPNQIPLINEMQLALSEGSKSRVGLVLFPVHQPCSPMRPKISLPSSSQLAPPEPLTPARYQGPIRLFPLFKPGR